MMAEASPVSARGTELRIAELLGARMSPDAINATPDSFSGDGLMAGGWGSTAAAAGAAGTGAAAREAADGTRDGIISAVAQARRMVEEGADLIDVGGESTRPGHVPVPEGEELARVVPVVAAIRAALPGVPISIDTFKPAVAAAALDAGAALLNDVWGVDSDDAMSRLAAARRVPIIVMHNRPEPVYRDLMTEVIADLHAAVDRAEAVGVPAENLIVDPGFGFGKTPQHNLLVLRELGALRALRRPILLGASRKSTLGRILGGVPPEERLEATLATTALGIAAGADIVRVHDVAANVRAARMADAVVRGWSE
jgi:dihydropteroate synthase